MFIRRAQKLSDIFADTARFGEARVEPGDNRAYALFAVDLFEDRGGAKPVPASTFASRAVLWEMAVTVAPLSISIRRGTPLIEASAQK